jgi:2-haloacid dehalogenase
LVDAVKVKALLFDTFGTVVDWRGSLIRDLSAWGRAHGLSADWAALADRWRGLYQPQMERVRSGARPWVRLDDLHRESLESLSPEFGLSAIGDDDLRNINKVWHRLDPWPDSVDGLTRLKRRYIIVPLSNGNVALLTNLAKHAGLPWDAILSTELTHTYKPQPRAYLGSCELLGLAAEEVMMCAAHNDDLRAARAAGLRTAFFPRATEYGPAQTKDLAATEQWDVIATDIRELAERMGC